jgi:hypothetical protein
MEIAAVTADASNKHTWLPPKSASAPNILIITTNERVSTPKGINDTCHEGSFRKVDCTRSSLFINFYFCVQKK